MLTSLRIQNFRSIRDASVKLGQVNLFIGPNNSGKSNFLKGVDLLAEIISLDSDTLGLSDAEFERMLSRSEGVPIEQTSGLKFDFCLRDTLDDIDFKGHINFFNKPHKDKSEITASEPVSVNKGPLNFHHDRGENLPLLPIIKNYFNRARRYQPDPAKFTRRAKPSFEPTLLPNGSNLVAFLFNLSQSHGIKYQALLADFRACVGNLTRVATPPDPELKGYIKLKFFDNSDTDFWAEEVSEGVLYFLALLCIVHQPDPPKLLLLEEPEKGIHPRRIREVMDFIFELARLRDIQIILTSHSPYVVDHFKDFPQCVSVFDRDPETGETVIHNAGDLIDESNAVNKAQGLPPSDYSSSLGEYWVSGFLGGVPL